MFNIEFSMAPENKVFSISCARGSQTHIISYFKSK